MMKLVFDVNILLDYFAVARTDDDTKAATALVTALSDRSCPLVFTPTGLATFRYLFASGIKQSIRDEKGSLTQEDVLVAKTLETAAADHLMDIGTIASEDLGTCEMARTLCNQHPDFEDNLIAAVALRIGADCIVTRDKGFAAHCPVACYTASEALVYVESGAWG